MKNIKYALLDADFVIKANICKTDSGKHLLDLLLEDETYQYICHEFLLDEISRHDKCGASAWMNKKIAENKIKVFTDLEMLDGLNSIVGERANDFYLDYLKKSCNSMSSGFYLEHYSDLDKIGSNLSKSEFLKQLKSCDETVGRSNSLGERKAMILFQFLFFLGTCDVHLFCSDDRKARIAFHSIAPIQCKSIISVYWDYYKNGFSKEKMRQYFMPLKAFMLSIGKDAGNIRVYDQGGMTQISIPCETVFDEIYQDKFDSLKNGFLRYK